MLAPFKCPICLGSTVLPNGFYVVPVGQPYSFSDCSHVTCKACVNGIIWSNSDYVLNDNADGISITYAVAPLPGMGITIEENMPKSNM